MLLDEFIACWEFKVAISILWWALEVTDPLVFCIKLWDGASSID
jgi:hypothetical protein